jgi:16S rRNA (adenine1518-N6/adenine1519-N6)-dimethyltransferase
LIKAKKKFGQNFLKDEAVLGKIIQSMPNDDIRVVEIGPGLGDLTKKLLQHKSVVAFEIDDELCDILKKDFSSFLQTGKFSLNCTDVLHHWKDKNLLNEKYNLVANLPYYVATKIVINALKDDNCKNIIVMLQSEVAYKFCAKEGDKDFSYLAVIADLIGNRSIICDVGPKSFVPPPKVSSSVLKIEKRRDLKSKELFCDEKEIKQFEQFLKNAFKAPRKTLSKNLSDYGKENINRFFSELDIDAKIRPHQLSSIKYLEIFYKLKDINGREEREKEDKPSD